MTTLFLQKFNKYDERGFQFFHIINILLIFIKTAKLMP